MPWIASAMTLSALAQRPFAPPGPTITSPAAGAAALSPASPSQPSTSFSAPPTSLSGDSAGSAPLTGPVVQPIPWRQNVFFIPYEFASAAEPPVEVRLFASRNQGQSWEVIGRAEPHVLGFNFRAPHDGEYWFSIRSIDRQGRMLPEGPHRPELRVVVDTLAPRLELFARRLISGEVEVAWQSVDPNIEQDSLSIEYQTDSDSTWRGLTVAPSSDAAQFTRSGGRRFQPPLGARVVRFRASVADQAGNRSASQAELALNGGAGMALAPIQQTPPPASTIAPSTNDPSTALAPSWPADGQTGPPLGSPYSASSALSRPGGPPPDERRVSPATPPGIAGTIEEIPPPTPDPAMVTRSDGGDRRYDWTPNDLARPSPDPTATPPAPYRNETPPPASAFASASRSAGVRLVNTRGFDLAYDVEEVGPSGIAKVELWGTADSGATWRLFAVDQDQRSPVRVDAPGEGTFGFRIVVENGSGLGGVAPSPGDRPDVVVGVDLTSPDARIVAAQTGSGNQADHLLIQWTARDAELAERPISLYWRPDGEGAWRTVAAALENTGQYAWRMDRDVPDRFWLRLDVRDAAGNIAGVPGEKPIEIHRPRPQGRILDVRPAGSAQAP